MICEHETSAHRTEQDLPVVRFCLFCNHPLVLDTRQHGAVCAGCGTDLLDATFLLTGEMLGEFDFGEDTFLESIVEPAISDLEIVEDDLELGDDTSSE